jgi:hypothetical protein
MQPKKCTFAVSMVEYLEHVHNREGIKANPKKVKAI